MKTIVIFLLSSAAIYLLIALGLVVSQSVPASRADSEALDFASAVNADYSGLPELETFASRDGSPLAFRSYAASGDSANIILLIHGSGWHGMQFHEMATHLSEQGAGHVIVPDLRGHVFAPQTRGDVDHIGQFEQDIADLVAHVREEHEKKMRIIIGGHSSGGGLVVRFAGGEYGTLADGFILMAPFLKYNAPTTRPNSGGWANVATRRLIGLGMLNNVGITAFNHLPVISFNMPASVLDGPLGNTATLQYSYRLNTGFAPRADYTSDLAAMRQPFLLLAGSEDESFYSDRYEGLISQYSPSGTYRLLDGVNHIGVVNAPSAVDAILNWVDDIAFK